MHVDKKLSTELDDVQNHFSQARLDLAFIKIENYMSELEKTIEQLKNQIK